MAKKPLPPKRTPVAKKVDAGKPGRKPKSEAVGKFDKFAAFALAIPSAVLAIIALVLAIGYTHDNLDVGFLGFPAKTISDFDNGIQMISGSPQITGFEQTNYIGHVSEGEMDVAVLNIGRENGVNLGDVFVLAGNTPGNVRLEFVVFDLQDNISRAYILLGQDVSNDQAREYSLRMSDLEELCGGTSGIDVSRTWAEQIVRRRAVARSAG